MQDATEPPLPFSLPALSKALGIEIQAIALEPVVTGGAHSRVYACRTSEGEMVLRIGQGQQGFYTHYFPERVDARNWSDQHWAIAKARDPDGPGARFDPARAL